MSLIEAREAVDTLVQNDELVSALGQCRYACERIAEIVKKASPQARVTFLVYRHPTAHAPEGDHYAVKVSAGDQAMIINTVPAPGFPEYIGDAQNAPGLFGGMVEVDEVE